MPSLRSRIVRFLVKRRKSFAAPGLQLPERRRLLDEGGALVSVARGTRVEATDVDGVRAEWLHPREADEGRAVLYLHGGGYMLGSCASHRGLASHVARACRARVLLPEYRLAPEHPFPAGLDDALACYRGLLAHGAAPERVAVIGDSAGGGLALAVLLSLRDAGEPLPAAAVLLSPWCDLAATGESVRSCAAREVMLNPDGLRQAAAVYHGACAAEDPLVSPLYAELAGLPPLLVQVGDHEILLDDSTRLAERARSAGVQVELEVWAGMWHVWQAFVDRVPEARRAVRRIGGWTRERWAERARAPARG